MAAPPGLPSPVLPSTPLVVASHPPDARQRWRVTYARGPVAGDRVGRVALDEWHASLVASGLPLAMQDQEARRPRLAFGPPLPAPATGDAELVDLWLLERLPRWQVRDALEARLPPDHHWIGAEDVWLGAPALAADVVAADWIVDLAGASDRQSPWGDRLPTAVDTLLRADAIERTRTKGGIDRPYDLRPLIADVRIVDQDPIQLAIRTRFDAERGAGRPEEVVAALGAILGSDLTVRGLRRSRLVLGHDQPPETRRGTFAGRSDSRSGRASSPGQWRSPTAGARRPR